MFGKLGLDAIPHDPIVLVTVAMMVLGGIALVAGITYFKKWGYLWN
jgi:cytochrome o ubiquinol oxidase subunit 1